MRRHDGKCRYLRQERMNCMWIVVCTVQSKETAEQMGKFLEEAGLLFKIRPLAASQETENPCYEVLVPESEAEQAHIVLIDNNM